jgi:hypothetical protein
VGTPERGLLLKPNCAWDGNPAFLFTISGKSDSNYATDETRRSISGYATYLNGSPITMKSGMQQFVKLSVTEAELVAAVSCMQDMLYNMRILESLGLNIVKPMILELDNQGAIDLINSWSVGGRTRHMDARQNFGRELKEEGLLRVQHVPGVKNNTDVFTKNLQGPLFEKHVGEYVEL